MSPSAALQPYNAKLLRAADAIAIATAASLPWSTSATGILIGLWLLAVLPTIDLAAVRRELSHPAAALVLLLVALAALGILWSEATWARAFQGFTPFAKLLVIPLLFIHFRQSERALWVFGAFLLSCALLLVASLILIAWPQPFGWRLNTHGIPVKDRIVQSGEFVLCAFGALYLAFDFLRADRRWLALALAALAGAFLANVLYIAASRTSLVVIPVLLLFLGFRWFGWKGTLALALAGGALGAIVWISSPHVQQRISDISREVQAYETNREVTSAGLRIDYWRKAAGFIKDAPVIGHGTGTIRQLFEKASGEARDWQTANPHNQTLAIGIQLGLVGIVLLWAVWLSHFLLFRGEAGLIAWIGEIVVVQNVVSSLFNSHLFDFTQGWIYVFGVGLAGAVILRRRAEAKSGADSQRPV
ncbi:MAG TPA: O-antigen ligase family protein [Xanthobacteraceae bacterium]|nr:O-antigen ligase family protein [Xanthobacteraceae bacterium]